MSHTETIELAPPLTDQSKWEYRIIKDVVWWRAKGYAVETQLTHLRGGVSTQSVEKYQINRALLQMIRNSPHNKRPMYTTNGNDDSDNSGSDNSGSDNSDGDNSDLDHGKDSNSCDESDDDKPLHEILTDIRKNK